MADIIINGVGITEMGKSGCRFKGGSGVTIFPIVYIFSVSIQLALSIEEWNGRV